MDADLDTLATALYVTTDELLKAWPGLARSKGNWTWSVTGGTARPA